MKLLVVSDTHGRYGRVRGYLEDYPSVTHIMHLGDGVRDMEDLSREYPDKHFMCVRGNNDFGCNYPEHYQFCLLGHTFFAAHGHTLGVRTSVFRLLEAARAAGADIALFGHTHMKYDNTVDGIRVLNPSSYGAYLITENKIEFI